MAVIERDEKDWNSYGIYRMSEIMMKLGHGMAVRGLNPKK